MPKKEKTYINICTLKLSNKELDKLKLIMETTGTGNKSQAIRDLINNYKIESAGGFIYE